MSEIIQPRKRLGTGHFDRKLIERMVLLSEADNYEEASKEWIATGKVYWGTMEIPDWWEDRAGECLCGHKIVYHFEVRNSENDNMILVGSDHINTYQIIREISLSTGLGAEMITEAMIDEWLSVRVAAMKTTAWWDANGELFTEMFDAVKDYDVRVNVRANGREYSPEHGRSLPITVLRKGSSGQPHDYDYKMASIVWRWNHPENAKNQRTARGYPTEKLWTDLIMFHARIATHILNCDKQDAHLLKLKDTVEKNRILAESQMQMLREDREKAEDAAFIEGCEYYGFPPFDSSMGTSGWERDFLRDIKRRMQRGWELTERQLISLKNILTDDGSKASEKQLTLIFKLGFDGPMDDLTKKEASALITKMIEEQKGEQNE